MLRNYLIVALRNILKNKTFVFINTLGLGIALACCITSYILVAYNVEFDNYYSSKEVKDIFRTHGNVELSGGDLREAGGIPSPIAPMALNDIAGIKSYLRVAGSMFGSSVSYVDESNGINKTFGENVVFADSTLFDFFDFPLEKGDHASFDDPYSLYMNQELAKKYFGDEDPIGKTLTIGFRRGVEKQFFVAGILEEIPVNSSLYLPLVIRFEHFVEIRAMDMGVWGDWNVPATFFKLENPDQAAEIAGMFDAYMPIRNEAFQEQEVKSYSLVHFKEKINPNDMTWSYLNTPINIEPLIVFVVLAAMILMIACFNLTNTSVAVTSARLKEIGIRKAVGAYRLQIMGQFMLETLAIIFLSLVVGYAVSRLIVPEFTTMWQLPYTMADLSGINLLVALLILVFFASMLAGIYPSFFGTKFHTVELLKGNARIKGTNFFTRGLVSIQFAISVIVLVAGIIFIQNTKYQEAIDFGYEKERLLSIDIQNEQDYRRFEAILSSVPLLQEFGTTEHHIGFSTYQNPITFENVDYDVYHLEFGENYFGVMDLNFLEGGPVDYEKASEREEGIIVSKQFLKTVGLQGNPIGQYITVREDRKRIMGVVDDFVDNIFRSKDPEPYIFYATVPERWRQVVVSAEPEDLSEINDQLEKEWTNLFPNKPYVSRFQEDILLSGVQQTNRNLKKIFLFLTILGGLLSASGIFSLASLNIAKRTKEIGIRKALGATISNVVLLLNREFIIILVVAGILGSLGGYFGTSWLLDMIYAYHIPMHVFPVIVAALIIFMVGILTTSMTTLKAAKANPVDTLRDE